MATKKTSNKEEEGESSVLTVNETRAQGDVSSVRKPRDVSGQNREKFLNSPMRGKK